MANLPDGILLADKPRDVTSFSVVGRVRKALLNAAGGRPPRGEPKFRVGHAGTLDPLATGLLIVLVGRGSRLSPFLLHQDKTYCATLRFGAETDTLDAEGEIVAGAEPPASPDRVAVVLPRFTGEIQQVPPIFSALKRDGQTLHRLARAGQGVAEPDARTVTISRLQMTGSRWLDDLYEVDLEIDCGSGTYIRSLARDIGRACGSCAYLRALRRTRVGPFAVEGACDVMPLDADQIGERLLPLDRALPHLPRLEMTAAETRTVLDGGQPLPVWLKRLETPDAVDGRFTMLSPDGTLIAVGELEPGTGLPRLAAVVGRKDV
ncbi:tRNA pseudouridine(55) synthase TruB [bacterium CG_4_9_14_3_um_filter_65_15]|nr:MAG: tRNA pseudouridine(55) synthase TruB [bacterium CG_4_9_14_3_um_filter_65_15]